MNPHIIIFKFFLLMSFGFADITPNQNVGLDQFVVKKQSSFSTMNLPFLQDFTKKSISKKSIMHKMTHAEKLAIFCKMEHEVMKASGFAVKFRLGDQSFVDQLEGK